MHLRSFLSSLVFLAIAALAITACSSAGASATPVPVASNAPAAPSASEAMMSHAPASAAASGPTTIAMGSFHKVDGTPTGTAALLHLADGSFAVSFEGFSIAAIAHANVILVSNADVMSPRRSTQKPSLISDRLKGTSGMQDFPAPAAMAGNAMGYHTVVLWDTQMLHATAAAPLK